jgi:hypothetical protein
MPVASKRVWGSLITLDHKWEDPLSPLCHGLDSWVLNNPELSAGCNAGPVIACTGACGAALHAGRPAHRLPLSFPPMCRKSVTYDDLLEGSRLGFT